MRCEVRGFVAGNWGLRRELGWGQGLASGGGLIGWIVGIGRLNRCIAGRGIHSTVSQCVGLAAHCMAAISNSNWMIANCSAWFCGIGRLRTGIAGIAGVDAGPGC